ncbi:MAG: NiFe hydrogenase [Shewanella sp.]|uniref:NiFe hydrogenase n=1 Tax=Shewanella sp. TaxID=50422 RepID=UPI003C7892DC
MSTRNHNIRFNFVCQKPVPLYAHLCNQYLHLDKLNISIGRESNVDTGAVCYFIEACAPQAELEQLADDIAADFLLSVWLQQTEIKRIDTKSGSTNAFSVKHHKGLPLYFCQHCQPQFGDNQHPQFGEINLPCEHCKGHYKLSRELKSLTRADIAAMANSLLTDKVLALPMLGLQLSILNNNASLTEYQQPRVLICNPNSLNSQFCVSAPQVLALSSIEKPLIRVRPCSDHPNLHAPLYDIQFADNRLLVILCEILRQKGIHWVYVNQLNKVNPHIDPPLRLASVAQYWIPTADLQAGNMAMPSNLTCLHDEFHYKTEQHKFSAKSTNNQLQWQVVTLQEPQTEPVEQTSATDIKYSLCAMSAGLLRHHEHEPHSKPLYVKNAAVLYFGQHHASQIVTVDSQSDAALFFQLPTLPNSGYEVCHSLLDSPQKSLLDKFKQLHPAEYNQLLDLHISDKDSALTQLMAVAAAIIGAGLINSHQGKPVSAAELADRFIALAMTYQGNNAPRIDFPLTKGMAHRSLNWCRTLGSLMSFKLAGDANLAKLAFAFHDSFADYLSHWIEHVDQNVGVKQLVVAGSDFANPVLAERVHLRIGKNYPLQLNPLLDLDGVNIAVGGLYLKQRRG